MNDQLRTLVRQAVVAVDIVTGNESLDDELAKMYIPDCFAEKFAELIVKECANIVWDEAEKTMSSEVNDAGYKIIEYFGVAEREE